MAWMPRLVSAGLIFQRLITCPACGLPLPEFARFCARCGKRLPFTRGQLPPLWVLVLFWLGTAATLVITLVYGTLVTDPNLAVQTVADPGQVRQVAGVVAVVAGCLFVPQLVTSIGLTLGRSWAKGMATLVCVAWALTCVGLPVSVFALSAIWRPLKPGRPAPAPPP
jgi:hypothetical protein